MISEPLYDNDLVNLGYLNTRLGDTNSLLLSKTQNFGTIPTPPYRKYDTYMGSDGIYICINERLIGDYNAADWTKASTYVNVEDAIHTGITTDGTLQASNGGTNVAGLTGVTSGDSATRIWAGATFANRGSAPFRVTQGGAVTASNINITGGSLNWGNLNKPSKTDLGGWTTYMNDTGIYTGTLTADQVNAVAIDAGSITAGTLNGTNVNIINLNASNITSGTISGSSINLGSGKFTVNTSGVMSATGATISGTINAGNGSVIGGLTMSSGILSSDRLTLNALIGQVAIFPSSGGSHIFSNGARISATAGVAITSNSTGTIPAPSVNVDIKACSGATAYLACMINANGTGERSAVEAANGTLYLRSTGAIYANNVLLASGSSKNMKKNIKELKQKEINLLYKEVGKLPLYKYNYKKEYSGQKNNYGIIIEDFENNVLGKILHVVQNKNDKNMKNYSNEDLNKVNLILIKELMKKIEKLEEKDGKTNKSNNRRSKN